MEMIVCNHVDAKSCTLFVIADVHIGSPDCDEELFLDYVNLIAQTPDARALILGDLLDYVTKIRQNAPDFNRGMNGGLIYSSGCAII